MHEKQSPKATPQKDYNIRRKRIWKGQFAQTGYLWIVIDMKKGKSKYTNAMLLEGGLGQDVEDRVAELLRDGLKKKFGV